MAEFDPELNKMMQEVAAEMSDYFKQNEEKFASNQKKFEDIHQKLYSHVEKTCSKEVEWLKQNSNPANKDFDINMKQFEDCARQNDFGFSEFVKGMQIEQENFYQKEEQCVLDCKKNNKETVDIKDYLRKCLISSTEMYNALYDKVDGKMNEINTKL